MGRPGQDANDYVPEPMKAAGITYRQLDYWCKRGHLCPAGGIGRGNRRDWPPSEIAVGVRIAELITQGFRLDAAAQRAREQVSA